MYSELIPKWNDICYICSPTKTIDLFLSSWLIYIKSQRSIKCRVVGRKNFLFKQKPPSRKIWITQRSILFLMHNSNKQPPVSYSNIQKWQQKQLWWKSAVMMRYNSPSMSRWNRDQPMKMTFAYCNLYSAFWVRVFFN